jgi:hypothetical protein
VTWRLLAAAVLVMLGASASAQGQHGRGDRAPRLAPGEPRSVDDVRRALDGTAGARVRAGLAKAGVSSRPTRLWLLAIKDERRLELWASRSRGERVRVTAWSVLAASGSAGPKLREGDRQVPEGNYRIDRLNPNSAYHLSLRLDYPNADDRAWAAREGRVRLGGDIFIHGKDVSIGCLALGDRAVEELFWLAAIVGKDAFTVVIVPTDLRTRPPPRVAGAPAWTGDLYESLRRAMSGFVVD